jgi:Ca2+-transporting ATPase
VHKLHVVRALQDDGHVIAMIGDGTNDGPALRAADVGITLGVNGTDAARTIADVVLARDELETMIIAVRHGRAIYDNIRKAIHFLVSTNSSEVMLTVGATAFGISQPLNTAQLLWINLVTDVAIAFALGSEQPEADLMRRPPRSFDAPIIGASDYQRLLGKGALISTAAFVAHLYGVARYGQGGGIALLSLISAQLLDGISSRSETQPFWQLPINPSLRRSLTGLVALQVLVSLLPVTRRMLGIMSLDWLDLGVISATSIAPFIIIEARKALQIDSSQDLEDTSEVTSTI